MESDVHTVPVLSDTDLRAEAISRIEKKREFRVHLFAYTLVNIVVWAIWAIVFWAAGVWFPWPAFVTLGWGIGVAFHAWDVYGQGPITEQEIEREADRLRQIG